MTSTYGQKVKESSLPKIRQIRPKICQKGDFPNPPISYSSPLSNFRWVGGIFLPLRV